MATNEISVELRKHIGHRNSPLGPVEVEHDQWYVIVSRNGKDPKQVGYMNKAAGNVLYLSGNQERFGPHLCKQIEEAAALEREKLIGGKSLPSKGDATTKAEEK